MELQKRDFVRIVESNQGIIKSLCNAYYRNLQDQKDAFQDIVLQLWKSLGTFRGDSKISTWIYSVGLNTILAKIRKEKRQMTAESICCSEIILSDARADDDTELLNMVLGTLKVVDKAIVILYLEGYKYKEISQILNLTPTNVSTRINRLKSDLKTKFKDQPYEPRQS